MRMAFVVSSYRLQQDARHLRLQPWTAGTAQVHMQPRPRQILQQVAGAARSRSIARSSFASCTRVRISLKRGSRQILRSANGGRRRLPSRMRGRFQVEAERREVMPERVVQVLRNAQPLIEPRRALHFDLRPSELVIHHGEIARVSASSRNRRVAANINSPNPKYGGTSNNAARGDQ